jgi:enoyl-CoA hydratase/carnithine racemase
MILIRLPRYAPEAATGLCPTCTWGTVRKGFRENEAETFCRLIGRNSRVSYAVRECNDYCDRRVPMTASEARRYGFATEIRLDAEELRSAAEDLRKQPAQAGGWPGPPAVCENHIL